MARQRYIDRLTLFEAVRNDEIAGRIAGLIYDTDEEGHGEAVREAYYTTQRTLLKLVGRGGISGNYLQNHLCRVIAGEENVFTRMAEDGVFKSLEPGMTAADIKKTLAAGIKNPLPAQAVNPLAAQARLILMLAAEEIGLIAPLYRFSFGSLMDAADEPSAADEHDAADKHSAADRCDIASAPATGAKGPTRHELVHKAMTQSSATDAAILLARYHNSYGSGIFEPSSALNAEESGLVPVKNPDPITMDDLIGYERQKGTLIDNTRILLSGMQANNVLLYGDSGTGKSSSVKALLNKFAGEGLKMISVPRDRLPLLPGILEQIAGRGMKFMIFIDDLSFGENEHEYKAFKSIMEGRVTPRPDNTIFIVTSNRKKIVQEGWGDREGGGDVRLRDNMQEKQSLADRFGITLVYSAPDKHEYLAIVKSMAEKAGLAMPEGELAGEALKWEIRHGGRSGRTARQFVDYMAGIRNIEKGGA
ncbi:MAG: ATP-binding protein [Clostridiales bacterium]|nr:ATP-binding protein [Clostridiales bacterium]